jgi:hypothetical protein
LGDDGLVDSAVIQHYCHWAVMAKGFPQIYHEFTEAPGVERLWALMVQNEPPLDRDSSQHGDTWL